jgi:hypothetical protein
MDLDKEMVLALDWSSEGGKSSEVLLFGYVLSECMALRGVSYRAFDIQGSPAQVNECTDERKTMPMCITKM